MESNIYLVDFRERNPDDNIIGILFDNGIDIQRHEDGRVTILSPPQAMLALRRILNAWYDIEQQKQQSESN